MIFDTFCGMVERHWTAMVPLLQRAHLFEFPVDPQRVLPKTFDDETAALLSETFFLPFPVVAVEDPVSCLVLFDKERDQQGVNTERRFAECLPVDYEHLSRAGADGPMDEQTRAIVDAYPAGLVQISVGRVLEFHVKGSAAQRPLTIAGKVDRTILCTKRRVYGTSELGAPGPTEEQMEQAVLRNVTTAYEELFYFNTPNRFVVERENVGGRPHPPHLKVRRSTHRPRYILLTPGEIQERLGTSQEHGSGRKSPIAHARRRHYRRLTSERYREARGKVLCIPATWVGPEEAVSENVRYRVRIDL